MKIAVVGATGLVGQKILQVLAEQNLPITELIPVASEKSVGKKIQFKNGEYTLINLQAALERNPDIALFSAGGEIALEWAPKFAASGTKVIDNSSAWRMNPEHHLVVPEINADQLTKNDNIIANPNCSTTQLVMALYPLHKKFKIKRVIVSTYQSITGTGVQAVEQLENEMQNEKGKMVYPYPIHQNAIPHCDVFTDNDYTKEEMKLTHETKKILADETIQVVATSVRIPVMGGHSESVNIEFENEFDINEIRTALNNFEGIKILDNTSVNVYPMPIYAKDKDAVFVGRIRRDFSIKNGLNLWIVADNLRKGAATNAVQIAKHLIDHQLL